MAERTNEFGQPIGKDLGDWSPPDRPPFDPIDGSWVRLEPLTIGAHCDELFDAYGRSDESMWTYLPYGPFESIDQLAAVIAGFVAADDVLPFAALVDGKTLGFLTMMRIQPANGVLELGAITFSEDLQRTAASTDAIHLLMSLAFDCGYRRVEWKCDSLNEPSRRAARRLGFEYEGTFAKATHYKGRSRDTAWFSLTDDGWPMVNERISAWLDAENFGDDGLQRTRLTDIT